MSSAALLLAPLIPVPERLPAEPPRTTPYEQAVQDFEPSEDDDDAPWPEEADYPDPFAHQPSRDGSLQALLHYRDAGYKPVRRANGLAFLGNSARADAFHFGIARRDELGMLRDIAWAYGGDHVAIWTFGRAVHLWAARSSAPGARPVVLQLSVRLDAPRDVGRPAGTAERIARWLEGSALAPDVAALRRTLESPRLSVPAWFAAFGVPGAKDLEAPDTRAAWSAFEQVADALLRGAAPDAAARTQVNALIDTKDSHLPGKPASKRGATARRVAEAFVALREVLGAPAAPRLAACFAAANLYDSITSGPAGDRLLQTTRKPLAVSLALGRLLAHYPVEVRRDPIFLALASFEAEVWNGHSFVDPLAAMAEDAGATGFTIAVVPPALEEEFRHAHGVRADESAARDGWAGEAAIEMGEGSVATFAKWFAKARADGAIVRGEGSGACRVLRFAAGQLVEDAPSEDAALGRAARALDPRGAILAAGFPDVLEPGALAEAPRASAGEEEAPVVTRAALAARLDAGSAAQAASLLDPDWSGSAARVALLVRPATRDEHHSAAIVRDLRTAGWRVTSASSSSSPELWFHSGEDTMGDVTPLVRVLGDLPTGSTVAFARNEAVTLLGIAPEIAATLPMPTLPAPSPDWVPPRVVLETDENVYATADFARLAWYREDGEAVAKQLARRYPGRVDGAVSITPPEALAVLDEALRALGFTQLGDLLASHLHAVVVRAYTHVDGVSTAIIVMLPRRPLVECELQTKLADGTEVTTSSLDIGQPARRGASVRRAALAVPALWEVHERHLADVRGDRALQPAPATLADFARLLES